MYQVFVVEDELLIRQSIRNVIENMPGPYALCGEASDGEMALSILGSMPLKELNLAILLGDITALSRAPGVGKKTAQRIALELKDKVSQSDVNGAPSAPAAGGAVSVSADVRTEALEALQALGYTPTEARAAVAQVKNADASVDEIIRLALRGMAGL